MALSMIVIGVAGLIVNVLWHKDTSWLGIQAGIGFIFALIFGIGLGIIIGQEICIGRINRWRQRALEKR